MRFVLPRQDGTVVEIKDVTPEEAMELASQMALAAVKEDQELYDEATALSMVLVRDAKEYFREKYEALLKTIEIERKN